MRSVYRNPELVRYARERLRRKALIIGITLVVCLAIMLIVIGSVDTERDVQNLGKMLFWWFFGLAFVVSWLVNSAVCALSVSTEYIKKTYDFQLMTRLTARELFIGKLLGAPIVGYLVISVMLLFALVSSVLFGVPLVAFVAATLLLLLTGLVVNALGVLVSSYIKSTWMFIVIIVLGVFFGPNVLFFLVFARFVYDIGAEGFVHVMNPFGTIAALINGTPAWSSVFGAPLPSFLVQLVFWSVLLFIIASFTCLRLKQVRFPMARYTFTGLFLLAQLLLLAVVWPPIGSSLVGMGGAYADIEMLFHRVDFIDVFKSFLAVNAVLLVIAAFALLKPPHDLDVWMRSHVRGVRWFFEERSLSIATVIPLAVSAVGLFFLSYLVFGRSTMLEAHVGTFSLLAVLFVLFVFRESAFLGALRLSGLGRNAGWAVLFLGLFYVLGSAIAAIVLRDGTRDVLLNAVFPLTGILNDLSFDVLLRVVLVVGVESAVLAGVLVFMYRRRKNRSLQVAQQ